MQTVCLLGRHRQSTDEWLIMATPALHTGYRIIKAWGYVLIILLNSDEILKSFSLRLTSRIDETKAQHSLCAQAHMCFYICSGYFNLMLNKLRSRLKDNNVSSSTQASLPERVIAHQQAGRQAAWLLEGKLANSHHRRSRSSHACVSCLSPVKVADALSLSFRSHVPVDWEKRIQGWSSKGRGGGVVLRFAWKKYLWADFF